jgi:hypothetical protein
MNRLFAKLSLIKTCFFEQKTNNKQQTTKLNQLLTIFIGAIRIRDPLCGIACFPVRSRKRR